MWKPTIYTLTRPAKHDQGDELGRVTEKLVANEAEFEPKVTELRSSVLHLLAMRPLTNT